MPGALEPRNCINYPGIQMTQIGTSDWARASQINASLKDGSCNVCKSQEALRASDTFHFKHSDRHEGMKSDYQTMTLPLNIWKRAKLQSDNQKKTEVM